MKSFKDYFELHSKRKLTVFAAFILVAAVVLTVRLGFIMVIKGDYYDERATNIQERERSIKARRGIIYDRNGVVIADNKAVCSISVIHNQIEDEEKVIEELSRILQIDENTIRKKVEKVSSRETIKSNVDRDIADKIRALDLAGVMIDEDYKRYYPYDSLASKVIGFTGADNQGIVGLEVYYDDLLQGTAGSIKTLTDSRGIEIKGAAETRQEPVPGNNIITSIDVNIQQYTEQLAIQTMELRNANRVCIIVMNPQNGEIYALADVPEYNLNEPFKLNVASTSTDANGIYAQGKAEIEVDESYVPTADELNNMWRCFPISDTYEPGSTFKIVTATAAFEADVLDVSDGFYCPGYKLVGDRRIRCHKTVGHGSQTFKEGIMNSCNPVFMDIGARVGAKNFYKTMEALGLFEKTGIDLPGEATSIFHNIDNVKEVELATISFGQTFQITPLQLMRAASAVVNGGTLVTPHFGVYVTDSNNNIVDKISYNTRDGVVSEETSETMKDLLHAVVAEGTGKNAYVEGFDVGGKTATSEKLPRSSNKYISSFLGFAPTDNPQVMALVLIDEPEGTYYGGTIAAPVIGDLYENILPYIGLDKKISTDTDATSVMWIDDTVF
ncbi:MAG: peptidoglycan glycosyltransferase [Lachnospiraceae bacterium]|nr:peptidoglycan glycosyltransferase [Lachnospiraceae bacterium]